MSCVSTMLLVMIEATLLGTFPAASSSRVTTLVGRLPFTFPHTSGTDIIIEALTSDQD